MKTQLLLFFVCVLFCNNTTQAQDSVVEVQKNSLYIEFNGSSCFLYNISYDRIVFIKDKEKVSVALGLQYLPSGDSNRGGDVFSISPQIIYLKGKNHYLELGLGYYINFVNKHHGYIGRVGYRLQKKQGGRFFKIGFAPAMIKGSYLGMYFFPDYRGYQFIPFPSLAVGYTFKK